MKSFLRWAGSKRATLSQLRKFWPGGSRRYIEPFCGSACFFFDIEPEKALLGDLNEELLCAFREIKHRPLVVLECLRRFPIGRAGYDSVRGMNPGTLALAERAARFLYLNRYCFNGLYRTNLAGQFNVPYGPPRSGNPADESVIIAASKALSTATLVHGDFEQTLEHVRAGDFVYLDPPYCVNRQRVFREYLPGSFALRDLPRFERQLRRLDEGGALFVVSYADCPEARKMLQDWNPRQVRTRRNIAGFSDHRRYANELVASNCAIEFEEAM